MRTTYRVTFGWSNFKDWDTEEWARAHALELARTPHKDPLQREVRLLEIRPNEHGRVLDVWERPSA